MTSVGYLQILNLYKVNNFFVFIFQIFIQTLVDLAYGVLGGASSLFAPKYYSIPHVGEAYLSFVGWNSTKMNDFRLRGVIRAVFSPFLLSCPHGQFDCVGKPFLQNFCPFSELNLLLTSI